MTIHFEDNRLVALGPEGCGAEILGMDLKSALSDSEFTLMRQAITEYKVLVLRGQQGVSPTQLRAFSARWGTLSTNSFTLTKVPVAKNAPFADDISGRVDMQIFENHSKAAVGRGDVWHTDVSYQKKPPRFTILQAQIIPKIGGDTLFMDMGKAIDYLPDDIVNDIKNKLAIHSGKAFVKRLEKQLLVNPVLLDRRESLHPLICQHPDSQQSVLFYNMDLVKSIDGFSNEKSQSIIHTINSTLSACQEIIYRHHWQVGDVLIWDNRASMHFAVYDYGKASRLMYRTMIEADTEPQSLCKARNKCASSA